MLSDTLLPTPWPGGTLDRLCDIVGDLFDHPGVRPALYDLERVSDEDYRLTFAVPGFSAEDLSVEQRDRVLAVTGQKTRPTNADQRRFVYRGLADDEPFEYRLRLGDGVDVKKAELTNGLLRIELVRDIPPALRPRRIPIGNARRLGWQARAKQLLGQRLWGRQLWGGALRKAA